MGPIGPTICIIFCFLNPQAAPPVTVTACPRVVAHANDWQAKAAAGARKATPEVQEIVGEWINLRDQAHACQTAGKVSKK